MSKVIVLSDAEIEKVLDEKSVIIAVEGAYRQKSDNRAAVWPDRKSTRLNSSHRG